MAKKTTTESGQEPTGKEIRTPADTTIKVFNVAYNSAGEEMDTVKETLKDASDIAKKKFLHMPSFKVVKTLFDNWGDGDAKNAEKLAVWLANFDKYRKYYKLDELGNLQGRMFAEGEIGSKPEDEIPDDEETEDLRPRHLRQPGASVTSDQPKNPVQEMAEKSGAKTSNVTPIDQVGRGKPH
jgi:hypothetical protein